ncbi:uncharacterized protein TEOVI_000155200 [Trypanosoma equiperdum]|uniref:Uncharacterized protein n=2 Tax=Trypanozoon TaxID=39700 RepID=Q38D56_TRYB2|nr:hypothetical protein, conserved [Trypanosoma brucei brucei TREU927]EAN77264.1 hypothetical protein, conserved [Trypanosoma brucei brucei TREU927]SCU69983.1 hypothetical protein, conserved [Trypanosoma equiperdum]
MHCRLLATNIPLHITAEEFYDYVRAHSSGDAVVNALLITRPGDNGAAAPGIRKGPAKRKRAAENPFVSSGAALIDYETKAAADAARRVDFLVGDTVVMLNVVGSVAVSGQRECEKEGRKAYEQLRCGIRDDNFDSAGGRKRPPPNVEAAVHEMEVRLVGIPTHLYGNFLGGIGEIVRKEGPRGEEEVGGSDPSVARFGSAVVLRSVADLFFDVALAIRHLTMGEMLSLRRVCDDEALITVPRAVGIRLLELASEGHGLQVTVAVGEEEQNGWKVTEQSQCVSYYLSVHKPRAQVMVDGENLQLVKKHEVLRSMANMMEHTNAKVAGFVDPFGNVLIPRQ